MRYGKHLRRGQRLAGLAITSRCIMDKNVIDAANSLKRQFEEASARWPNLTSVLVLWPEAESKPSIPNYLRAPFAIPVPGPDEKTLAWDGVYADRLDMPGRRCRIGCASLLTYWRRFGKFGGDQNETADPDLEMECDQRFRALAEVAGRLIDDLHGAGLSADTLGWGKTEKWRAVTDTRWQLAVHELTKPERCPLRDTSATYEKIPDLFLASATAVSRLVSTGKPPKKKGKARKERPMANRDAQRLEEFKESNLTITAFARTKHEERSAMSKSLSAGRRDREKRKAK